MQESFDGESVEEDDGNGKLRKRSVDFENASINSCSCYQLPGPEAELRKRLEH